VQAGYVEPLVSEPESIASSLYLFLYILAATGVILLIIRFKSSLLRFLEIFILFFSSWITFSFLFPITILYIDLGLILAILLIIWRKLRPSIFSNNITIIFSISGVGALLGASLGVLPAMIFVLLVSIYDFISVFITKHMVFMAKAIVKQPTIFTVSVPSVFGLKKVKSKVRAKLVRARVFNLGTGDIVLPLIFIVSLLTSFGFKYAMFSLIGVTIALVLLLNWRISSTDKKSRPLPAMPFLALGLFGGFWVALLV